MLVVEGDDRVGGVVGQVNVAANDADSAHLLDDARERATCELGDVDEYRARRAEERRAKREARQGLRARVAEELGSLEPGDVLLIGGHRLGVISVSHRKGGLRIRTIDVDARVAVLDEDEFDGPPERVGTIALPEPYDPQNRIFQRQAASALRKVRTSSAVDRARARSDGREEVPVDAPARAIDLPVAACPDLDAHLAAAAERDRLTRQLAELDRRVEDRTTSLTRRFDAIEALLAKRHVLRGWSLTARGEVLARTFHESDLLVATVVKVTVLLLASIVQLVTSASAAGSAMSLPTC